MNVRRNMWRSLAETDGARSPESAQGSRTASYRAIALALALLPAAAVAQNAEMINVRDDAVAWESIDALSRGENPATTVQSISRREAGHYGLDPAGSAERPKFFLDFRAGAQPYVIGWNGLDVSRRLTDTSLFDRLRLDDPVLLVGLQFGGENFFSTMELDFGTDSLAKYASSSGMSAIWQPLDYLSYWTFPEEGYAAWAGEHWTVAAGRLRTGIGLGDTNIFLNGSARWYDQAQATWWMDKIRFFAFWGTSSSHLSSEEYAIQEKNDSENGWDTENNHDASTASVVPFKMFTYHRLELKPREKIGFGLAEMQLVGGKEPDFTNLLPELYWHNTYTAGVTNVMAQADAWAVPTANILLWGEFVMDDTRAPSESKTSKPNCWAWELGARYAIPIESRDWRFSLDLEYSHADKWTYARWQPYLTMYQRQLITGGHSGFDIPLGHPLGGDVDEGQLTFRALTKTGKRFEVGYSFIRKGPVYLGMIDENGNPIYYDYDDLTETEGALDALLGDTMKYTNELSVKASWPLTRCLSVNGGLDLAYVLNAEHVAGDTAIETVYSLGFKWATAGRLEQ